MDYGVKAPRKCSSKLNGVSNTVLADGFEGAVSVNSVSGEITLRDLTGSMHIHSISGEVYEKRITSSLELDTVSRDVTLKESNLSSIKANTISSDLRMSTGLSAGPCDFKSVSGQVRMSVPPDTHCTGELHSVSGDLVSAFPVAGYSHPHGSQTVNYDLLKNVGGVSQDPQWINCSFHAPYVLLPEMNVMAKAESTSN